MSTNDERQMAEDLVPIRDVVNYGDCWRAVCPICMSPGPGAETPAEARRLALLEEFVLVGTDGLLVCTCCMSKLMLDEQMDLLR